MSVVNGQCKLRSKSIDDAKERIIRCNMKITTGMSGGELVNSHPSPVVVWLFFEALVIPQTALGCRGSDGVGKG